MKKFAANDLETDDVINSTKQLTAESFNLLTANTARATPSSDIVIKADTGRTQPSRSAHT